MRARSPLSILPLLLALLGTSCRSRSLGLAPPPPPRPAPWGEARVLETWVLALATGDLEPFVRALAPDARAQLARGFTDPDTTLFLLERSPAGRALLEGSRWRAGEITALGRVREGAREHVVVLVEGDLSEPIVITLVEVEGRRALDIPPTFREAGDPSDAPPESVDPPSARGAAAWAAWSELQAALEAGDAPAAAALLHPDQLDTLQASACGSAQRAWLGMRCALPPALFTARLMSDAIRHTQESFQLTSQHQLLGAVDFLDGQLLLIRDRLLLPRPPGVPAPSSFLRTAWVRPVGEAWRVVAEPPKGYAAAFQADVQARSEEPFPIIDPAPLSCTRDAQLAMELTVGGRSELILCEDSVRAARVVDADPPRLVLVLEDSASARLRERTRDVDRQDPEAPEATAQLRVGDQLGPVIHLWGAMSGPVLESSLPAGLSVEEARAFIGER